MIARIALGLTAVAFLAIVIHISAILLVPTFSEKTRWSDLYDRLEINSSEVLASPRQDNPPLDLMDPMMVMAVCKFDLAGGAIGIELPYIESYWSLSLVSPQKTTLFTINDRTTGSSTDIVYAVLTDQAPRFYASLPDDGTPPLVIETSEPQGIAVLRILADEPSLEAYYRTLSSEYSCAPAELE